MYILDGHNLIPKIPGLSLQNPDDEQALIARLQTFSHGARRGIAVYFDGAPPGTAGARRYGAVTAHFVRLGTTADSAIEARLLKMGRAARNVIVVSSDRRVQAAARSVGAQVLSSESFAERLLRAPVSDAKNISEDPNARLSQDEVAEWLALFRRRDKNTGQK